MDLTVNGEPFEVHGEGTIPALLAQLGAVPEHTVLTVNGRIIPAADRERTVLNQNDCVEVLTFVGGG